MICQLDPWAHRERGYSAADAAVSETLLALCNGYLGIRGTLDEGQPAAAPGTYLSGVYELRPLAYPERGYADPAASQVLIGATDGTRIRPVVDGEPLDIRTGTVVRHERVLDLRAGMLVRELHWRSPSGNELRLRSRRLVSLEHRELAAIEWELEPLGGTLRIVVDSELCAELGAGERVEDPRAGGALPPGTLVPRLSGGEGHRALLVHQARVSGQLIAAGMDHLVLSTPPHHAAVQAGGSRARFSLSTTAAPGRPVRLAKLLAYHHGADGDPGSLAAGVHDSLDRARTLGFEGLAARQRACLEHVWEHANIELDGDPEIQHALRYARFQLHQNAALAAGSAIPAKGLTGDGYGGHTFWDTEVFVLPVLSHYAPHLVSEALCWRASTLPEARERARRLGLRGAAFPWRTIAGQECSGYLPAGTAAFHINADIAAAVVAYLDATGDERFERETGAQLLVETARLWVSLGHHDQRRGGRFSIDGVTGPDEYSPLVDNNLFTNVMARSNLRAAADVVDRLGAEALGVHDGEVASWRRAADQMTILYDSELGIHLQDEDFARHARFDFDGTPAERYPLFLHVPYFELYRRQVIKQPDLVLAMALCPDAFTAEQKLRNFAYYEALTVRDSSLSAGTQAVLAAEIGDVQLAYEYLAEAALLDHHDLERNTADGLHLAALAGGWLAVIAGLAGARHHGGELSFSPRLPPALSRIAFPFAFRGRRLRIEVAPEHATYELKAGAPLEIRHWGQALRLEPGAPARAAIPPADPRPPLRQPAGRAPRRLPPPAGADHGANGATNSGGDSRPPAHSQTPGWHRDGR